MSKLFLAFLPFLLISGCVPRSHVKRAQDQAFKQADAECIQIQNNLASHIRKLEGDVKRRNDRLYKFNQVDKTGTLRNSPEEAAKKLKEREHKSGPTGQEDWLK